MSHKSPLTALAILMVVASCAGPTLVMARDTGASVLANSAPCGGAG